MKENTLRDYLRIFFRYKILFFIVPIVVMIPVYLKIQLSTPSYRADVKMLVTAQKEIEAEYYKEIYLGDISLDHAELVRSKIVLERVVKALKLYELPQDYEMRFASPFKRSFLKKNIRVYQGANINMSPEQKELAIQDAMDDLDSRINAEGIRGTSLFVISAIDFDPNLAVVIANSLSRSYIIFDLEQQVAELKLKYGEKHAIVLQLNNYINELQKTLDGKLLPGIDAIGPATIKIIQQATSAARLPMLTNSYLPVAFVVGIFLSAILAIVFNFIDQTIKSPHEAEMIFNAPLLGSIPRRKNKEGLLIRNSVYDTKYGQSFQLLSNQMYSLIKHKELKSLLFTDAEASIEPAVIVANIGIYLSNNVGCRVVIIDANLRAPVLSELFAMSNDSGLIDVLEDKVSFEDALQHENPNLSVLVAGETQLNPITLLDSSEMVDIIRKATDHYEIVLIYCADIKNHSDALILSTITNGLVLAVNEGKIKRQIINHVITPFEKKNINITGVIMSNHSHIIPELIYRVT